MTSAFAVKDLSVFFEGSRIPILVKGVRSIVTFTTDPALGDIFCIKHFFAPPSEDDQFKGFGAARGFSFENVVYAILVGSECIRQKERTMAFFSCYVYFLLYRTTIIKCLYRKRRFLVDAYKVFGRSVTPAY